VSGADEEWLNRKDVYGLRTLVSAEEGTKEIMPGVTMIRTGGHFEGSCVLHWDGMLFIADTFMSVPVRMICLRSSSPLCSERMKCDS
jgi:glyoxylase-like metal-dependent hydrolase (beta-lactamase superfamily II)